MNASYYKKTEDVLFFSPITRLLAKVFGAKYFIYKCKTCRKIPTEIYGKYCLDHKK